MEWEDEGRKIGKKKGGTPALQHHTSEPLCGRHFEGNIEGGLYCSRVSSL